MSNIVKPEHPNKPILDIIEAHPDLYTEHKYEKGKNIRGIGNHVDDHWYIKSGLIKDWYYDTNINREIITNFLWTDTFLSTDIHRKVELPIDMEAVWDTVMYIIMEKNFDKMKAEHPFLEEYTDTNFKWMRYLLQEKSRIMNYNHLGKRYYELQKHYPFLHELSNEQLSYFLGCGKRQAGVARYWTPENDE